MQKQFYIQAEKCANGLLQIKEFYKFESEDVVVDGAGQLRPKLIQEGHIDEDIRKQNPKEVAEFDALLEADKDALFAEAKAEPGKKVFISKPVEPEPVAVEVKVEVEPLPVQSIGDEAV